MKYGFHDLGVIEQGHVLKIVLTYSAFVRIMDEANYLEYRNQRSYKAVSKYVQSTPYVVKLPRTAHWYVVVDVENQLTKVNSFVHVLNNGAKIKDPITPLPG